MTKQPLPDIPADITPELLLGWCDALGIDRGEAALIIGKAPNYWSRLRSGEVDMKRQELNRLLQSFRMRKSFLEQQS